MSQPISRQSFYDICKVRAFSLNQLADLADLAGVERRVVNAMFLGNPVKRSEAVSVIVALSQITGENYTLDNTTVSLLSEEAS
jgi:hypothetical protein